MLVAGSMIGSGIFHRLSGDRQASRFARLAVGRLARRRRAHHHWRPQLRRTRRHDAQSRRAICLLTRSFFSFMGIFIRLDVLSGNSNQHHRCRGQVGFAKYFGVFWKRIAEDNYLIDPVRIGSSSYAVVACRRHNWLAVCLIVFLTWVNTRGLQVGKYVQNTFTAGENGRPCGPDSARLDDRLERHGGRRELHTTSGRCVKAN